MKKIVLKMALENESRKKKALKLAAGVQGVDSVAVDMKEQKMTVIGDVDPVYLTSKLRNFGFTELLSVGPAKEEKKEEKKLESDAKKEEKKEEKKLESDAKKEKKPQGDAKKEKKPESDAKKEKKPQGDAKKEKKA